MLRIGLLATLAFSLWQTAAHAQMSHHQHASEAACEEVELALRVEGDAGLRAGRNAVARLDGRRSDLGGEFEGSGAQLFGTGSGHQGEAQSRLGSGCASPDRRREKWRHRAGVFDLQGQGVQRSGARHAVDRWRQELCRAAADHVQQREPALRGARPRCGRFGVRGLARQAQPGAGEAGGQEIRRRRAVLRVIEGRRRELHRGAAGQRQYLRVLPARSGVRRSRPPRGRVQEPLRRRCAGSRGHDVRRSGDAGRGSPRQQ